MDEPVEVLSGIGNTLERDTFIHIASYLDDQVIESLKSWNADYVNYAKNSGIYWREKIENLLKRSIPTEYKNFTWENIYKGLATAYKDIDIYPSLILSVMSTVEDKIAEETIKFLLEFGYSPVVGKQDESKNNALMTAIDLNKFKTAIILLKDIRIDPSIEVYPMGTALYYVSSRGYDARYNNQLVEFVKVLLVDDRVLTELNSNDLLEITVKQGLTEVVKLIIEKGGINLEKLKKAIRFAVNSEQLMTLIYLINIFPDRLKLKTLLPLGDSYLKKNIESMTADDIGIEWLLLLDGYNGAIENAATYGELNIVEKLQKDKNNVPTLVLYTASSNGHTEVVKFFIDKYKFVKFELTHAITGAITHGYMNIVRLLMTTKVFIFGDRGLHEREFQNPEYAKLIWDLFGDALSGLAAAAAEFGMDIKEAISDEYLTDSMKFYTKFKKSLIREQLSNLDSIEKIINILNKKDSIDVTEKFKRGFISQSQFLRTIDEDIGTNYGNIKKSLHCSTSHILNKKIFEKYSEYSQEQKEFCIIFEGFFMIFFKPSFSIKDIKEILEISTNNTNVNNTVIARSMLLIGAHLGYKELLNRGLIVTKRIVENVNYVSLNMFDILYD
jgi:hypothetical protein